MISYKFINNPAEVKDELINIYIAFSSLFHKPTPCDLIQIGLKITRYIENEIRFYVAREDINDAMIGFIAYEVNAANKYVMREIVFCVNNSVKGIEEIYNNFTAEINAPLYVLSNGELTEMRI